MNSAAQLNLARKWRSQQFDQIIGQDLSVRMLKNSLYLEHFFPVYLFSGQKGCGKTTTARVFASAINCEAYPAFKKHPKETIVPCLSCSSCSAMLSGKHPDFIEMDAASHTGVDNVRNIVDASSLMPLMGRKKIYLIDEAHMLSKAAFNAFLKILEEPPVSVLFILATTDPQKIIDTVRSRCFQLFFKPIESDILLQHLKEVCSKEGIAYETEGLELIIKQTEGSARDALNMLEAVRFASARVNKQAVFQVLGHIEDDRIVSLLQAVLKGKPDGLLTFLHSIDRSQCTATFLWQKFVQLLHACIWVKHGVQPEFFDEYTAQLKQLLRNVDWLRINACLDACYRNEPLFQKTTNQHAFFEMILLQLCVQHNDPSSDSGSGSASGQHPGQGISAHDDSETNENEEEDDIIEEDGAEFVAAWNRAVIGIAQLDDPLVSSIFKQGLFHSFDEQKNELHVVFSKRFTFFQDWLDTTKHLWHKVLQEQFNTQIQFLPQFTGPDVESPKKEIPTVVLNKPMPVKAMPKQAAATQQPYKRNVSTSYVKQKVNQEPLLDISNKEHWAKTHLFLNYFPGTVHEVKELSAS